MAWRCHGALRGQEDGRDGGDEPGEVARLGGELSSSLGGDGVEFGAAPLVGEAPFGVEPAVALHAIEGRIEGAFLDADDVAGAVRDPAEDAEAVEWAAGE